MRVFWFFGVCCGVCAAILVKGRGTADHNNTGSAEQLSQESVHRSAVFGGYYPDDLEDQVDHGHGYGYGYDQDPGYYPHSQHHPHHYHHPDTGLKTLLLPLAGVALLGAAAVFASTHPILLQLGVVSGRRRREVEVDGLSQKRLQDILLLEKFMSQVGKEEVERQERRLLASYLSCSGPGSACVARLACELHNSAASTPSGRTEQHIMDLVISEIINNEFIDEEMKKSIVRARRVGHFGGNCKSFACPELDNITEVVKQ